MLRFDLPLPSGQAWLELPGDAPEPGLQQARALAAAMPVLAALEAWWGIELPCPEPATGSVIAHGLSLPFEPHSALAGGRVCVSWSALTPGRAAPAELPVQWPQVPAQMRLQTLPAQRIDPAGLVPGAVLLLPAAFARRWAVQLQGIDAAPSLPPRNWRAAATWLPHEGHALLHGADAAAAATTPEPWSVWLVPPINADLRAWFGASPSLNPSIPPALAEPGLVELRHGEQPVAWGRLLPCGQGWALRLDRVDSHQAVPAWT